MPMILVCPLVNVFGLDVVANYSFFFLPSNTLFYFKLFSFYFYLFYLSFLPLGFSL